MSIFNKAVTERAQRETAWELSSIVTLKGLRWWQQLQGRLTTIAMITALNLLSELGVVGEEDLTVLFVGASGAVCVGLTALISMLTLNRIHHEHEQRQPSDLEMSCNDRSKRTFSIGDAEENAIAFAVV